MSTKVITGVVRLSFCHLNTPAAVVVGQDPKFSAMLLIDKKDVKTLAAINNAIKFEKGEGWPSGAPATLKQPLKDGDGMLNKKGEQRPETKGMFVINASSKTKPGLVDASRQPILDNSPIYSGCYCRCQLVFAPYNLAASKGIGCYLNNVQFIKDGPNLGGKDSAEEAFDAYEEDDSGF